MYDEAGYLSSIRLPSGCLSLVGDGLEKVMIEISSSTPGGGIVAGEGELKARATCDPCEEPREATRPQDDPPLPAPTPCTHPQPHHENPTESLKLY